MSDQQPPPTAPNMRSFTLDSAYAHALLAPRAPSMLPPLPCPERPQVVIDRSLRARPRDRRF